MKENIGTVCKVLAFLSLAGGIILGIYLGVTLGKTVETGGTYYLYTRETRDTGLTLMYILMGFISGFIEFVVFYAISVILENQAEIQYRLSIFNNNTASPVSAVQPIFKDNSSLGPDGWKCPQCGGFNAHYVGSCKCGYSKY